MKKNAIVNDAWRLTAEDLLTNISQTRTVLADIAAKRQAAVEKAARPYDEQAAKWQEDLSMLEAELTGLMAINKLDMFDSARSVESGDFVAAAGEDIVPLSSGVLRYAVENPVVKSRNMLETLKSLDRTELIIVIEKPDWPQIETFNTAGLAAIGARRQLRERFEYDVKPFIAQEER
jgi:hypothetical protein